MTSPTPDDVYAPPQNAPTPAAPGGRERHLGVVVILSLVLGIMGVLGGFSSIFGAFVNSATLAPTQPGMTPDMAEAQQRMIEELRVISMPVVTTLIALVTLGLEGFAAYTSWLTHRGLERGRALLANSALPLVMVLAGFKAVWTVVISYRSYGVLQRFAEQMTSSMPNAADVGAILSATMLGGIIIGAVVGVGWGAILLGFYTWARRVLLSEEVIAKFEPAA